MKQHIVKCKYCGQSFDINQEEYVKPTEKRYAHKRCQDEYDNTVKKEEKERQALLDYINELFKGKQNFASINRSIKKFKTENNYTYNGMRTALIYFYEIKHGDLTKANNGINIIPFIYQDAYNYYYSLWEARERNKGKVISGSEEIIVIPSPKREEIKKKKLFSFLDEEEG